MSMPAYEVRYETRFGRCAWCWQPLPEAQSHTVISAVRAPVLELRLHHQCWTEYAAASGLGADSDRDKYRDWKPERLELLRIHLGDTLEEFAAKLHTNSQTLRAYMMGTRPLSTRALARLPEVAITNRFEVRELIDWSDRRAVFCLLQHAGWTQEQLAAKVGVTQGAIRTWCAQGVPVQSQRHRMRLTLLAGQVGYDAGAMVNDRLWTVDLVRAAIDQSGKTVADWARAGGMSYAALSHIVNGRSDIVTREQSYKLTRAATTMGVGLPPVGEITVTHKRQPARDS